VEEKKRVGSRRRGRGRGRGRRGISKKQKDGEIAGRWGRDGDDGSDEKMDGGDDGKVGENGGKVREKDGRENEADNRRAGGVEKEGGGVGREREKMEKRVEELEKKWEEGFRIEERGEKLGEIRQRVEKLEKNGSGRGKEGGDRGLEKRLRKMEERWEWRERNERRRRVVIKGYKIRGKEVRSKVEDILKKIGAEVGVEEVREVKTGREEQGGFAVVSFRTEGEKREVMKKKGGLRGEGVWIEDDLTWKERQVRWKIREMVKEEESKGAKVWIGENRVMINGV